MIHFLHKYQEHYSEKRDYQNWQYLIPAIRCCFDLNVLNAPDLRDQQVKIGEK